MTDYMEMKSIEKFFLNTILMISIVGVFLVLMSNVLLYPEDTLSISISIVILCACILAYLLRRKYPTTAVLILTSVCLVTMSYQRLTVPNTTTTLSVVMIVGFVFSVMLKGRIMWIMHGITFIILNTLFVFHIKEAVTAGITYSVLYFVLTYATGVLKASYDRMHQYLRDTNVQLNEKAKEIEAQNEELLQIQDNLSALNTDLEKIVNERTAKIRIQNEILIKFSYTNAHHLRGPVARILGLASIYKLEPDINPDFFIEKMVDQAKEIDAVIKQINTELESNNMEMYEK
jgi:signal transduction histidine kinase